MKKVIFGKGQKGEKRRNSLKKVIWRRRGRRRRRRSRKKILGTKRKEQLEKGNFGRHFNLDNGLGLGRKPIPIIR